MDNDHNFPEKLAGKVDALIGRHGLGGEPKNQQTDKADDRNIPLLTDVIAAPKWSADVAAHPNSALQHSLHRLRDDEIDALSQEIFTRVFDRIDLELAAKLESRLAAQLTTHINNTVTQVLGDLRQEIANEIGDAVNAVLADRLRKK